MSYMERVIKEFLVESYENLDQLDRDLVTLESEPGSRTLLDRVFRTIHTIKGTSVFLGFTCLESLAHVGENLLHRLREGELEMNAEIGGALLQLVDLLRQIIGEIEATQQEGTPNVEPLIAELTALSARNAHEEPQVAAAPEQPAEPIPVACAPAAPAEIAAEISTESSTERSIETSAEVPNVQPQLPVLLESDLDPSADEVGAYERDPIVAVEAAPKENAADARSIAPDRPMHQQPTHAKEPAETKGRVADATIRVDVNLLDQLMNLVGELVLTRNQILQYTNGSQEPALLSTSQRLNLITTELQEGVMKTRMQPIGNIWNKFPRVIRDLSLSLQKEVELELEGKDTELDKTIIEAIKDPLTHVIRNAVDHGIERPDVRRKAGKPSGGTLTLRAFHEGGQVNIEVRDDGAGLNVERIRAKAIEKGLISAQQASRLSDREVWNLIFLPGFSTAEQVTNVSGRGVGMDVVKSNIEKIGGTVDVSSVAGRGSTLRMKIPLTLAIIPALIVSAREDRFAIPQVSLVELVRLDEDRAEKEIEYVHDAPVFRLRGRLLPLVSVHDVLELNGGPVATGRIRIEGDINIVVVQTDARQFGIVVDTINDTEEIVVKPLSKQLKGLDTYAGATIMGDGRIALILDVAGIAHRAGLASETTQRAVAHESAVKTAAGGDQSQTLRVCALGDRGRTAIPLERVARLEELPCDRIESGGARRVVQYRGEIMPLMHLRELLAGETWKPEREQLFHTVVISRDDRNIGLVVDGILDIVESTVRLEQQARRNGVLGAAIVQGRVTEMLDVDACVRRIEEVETTAV